jgi:hypothetical protein
VPDDRIRGTGAVSHEENQETVVSPDNKIILAVSRTMSNIFLHFPQDVEKKAEIVFSPLPGYGSLRSLAISLQVTKRSAR